MSVHLKSTEGGSNTSATLSRVVYKSKGSVKEQVEQTLSSMPEMLELITMFTGRMQLNPEEVKLCNLKEEAKKSVALLFKIKEQTKKIDPQFDSYETTEPVYITCAFPHLKELISWFYEATSQNLIFKGYSISSSRLTYILGERLLCQWGEKLIGNEKKAWTCFAKVFRDIQEIYGLLSIGNNLEEPSLSMRDKVLWSMLEEKSAALKKAYEDLVRANPRSSFVQLGSLLYKQFKLPCSWEDLIHDYALIINRIKAQTQLFFYISWDKLCFSFEPTKRDLFPVEIFVSSPEADRILCEHVASDVIAAYNALKKELGDLVHINSELYRKLEIDTPFLIADAQLHVAEGAQKMVSDTGVREFLKQHIFTPGSLEEILEKFSQNEEKIFSLIESINSGSLKEVKEVETYLLLQKEVAELLKKVEFLNQTLCFLQSISSKALTEDAARDLISINWKVGEVLLSAKNIKTMLEYFDLYTEDCKHDFRLIYGISIAEEEKAVTSSSQSSEDSTFEEETVTGSSSNKKEVQEESFSTQEIDALTEELQQFSIEGKNYQGISSSLYDALGLLQHQLKHIPLETHNCKPGEVEKMAYEIHSHAFLSLQNIVEAINSYNEGNFKKAGELLSLHAAIIDAYVAIEKMQNLAEYVKTGNKSTIHDFSQQIDPLYSVAAQQLLKESFKGTLAVRFPLCHADAIPHRLKSIYDVQSSAQEKILASLHLAEVLVEILSFSSDAKIKEVLRTLLEEIKQLPKLDKPIVQKLGKFKKDQFVEVDTQFQTLQKAIENGRWKTKNAINQIGFYVLLLKEVELYQKAHATQDYLFQRTRNLFLMEKLYEELLLFVFNTSRKQLESFNNVHNLDQLMNELRKRGVVLPEAIREALIGINIGNSTHYLFNQHNSRQEGLLANVFKEATEVLVSDPGFIKKEGMLERKAQTSSNEVEVSLVKERYKALMDYLPDMIKLAKDFLSSRR